VRGGGRRGFGSGFGKTGGQEAGEAMSPLIELRGITKRYPGVLALDGIDLDIEAGSVHALMGENGAGKSTLGKVICGLIHPDEGSISFEGKAVHFHDPGEAVKAGIGMVHQELLFCENLSVAENLCLGDTPRNGPFVDRTAMRLRAEEALSRIGAQVDPMARLGLLPVALQQLVQIAGAVAKGAKVLIFDEPTSSLSHTESGRLFELIDQLKADGVTCIYVSHRMNEIFRLCDTITVLRDGKKIATQPARDFDHDSLVSAMIGRELNFEPDRAKHEFGDTALAVTGLGSPMKFKDVTFQVRKGEIVGFAGLVGAGRTETVEAIFGLDPLARGEVQLGGSIYHLKNPAAAIDRGMGLVPEDRKRHGLVLGMKIRENETLPILGKLSRLGFIQAQSEKDTAKKYFDRLRVKAPSPESITGGLSGGNQQKVVMAKWLAADCDVLMVDEPTRGVDVGAKAEIHQILREIAASGKAVLMVSSELPELLKMADRILIFRSGRIVGELARDEADEEKLIRLMTGN
jgi:ABC-type sugar transport system ATPase subunit